MPSEMKKETSEENVSLGIRVNESGFHVSRIIACLNKSTDVDSEKATADLVALALEHVESKRDASKNKAAIERLCDVKERMWAWKAMAHAYADEVRWSRKALAEIEGIVEEADPTEFDRNMLASDWYERVSTAVMQRFGPSHVTVVPQFTGEGNLRVVSYDVPRMPDGSCRCPWCAFTCSTDGMLRAHVKCHDKPATAAKVGDLARRMNAWFDAPKVAKAAPIAPLSKTRNPGVAHTPASTVSSAAATPPVGSQVEERDGKAAVGATCRCGHSFEDHKHFEGDFYHGSCMAKGCKPRCKSFVARRPES